MMVPNANPLFWNDLLPNWRVCSALNGLHSWNGFSLSRKKIQTKARLLFKCRLGLLFRCVFEEKLSDLESILRLHLYLLIFEGKKWCRSYLIDSYFNVFYYKPLHDLDFLQYCQIFYAVMVNFNKGLKCSYHSDLLNIACLLTCGCGHVQ